MLSTIFLLKGKNLLDLNQLDIYSYPEDIVRNNNKDFVETIIIGHDQGIIREGHRNDQNTLRNHDINKKNQDHFVISIPIPQKINENNIYTISINSKMIIGLIFDEEDNPYDYKEIFEDLFYDLINNEKCCSFEDELEIENLLITLFIDLRRYGDEILAKYPEVSFQPVGINFFAPTRKFDIKYVQKEKEFLAFWDIPGQISFREKWLKGIQDSNILVYMIDVANQLRFEESKQEFWNVINEEVTAEIPLLILGNKIDLINHSKDNNQKQLTRIENEIINYFEFHKLRDREWNFLFTSVKTNYNIESVLNTIFTLTSHT
ncbi:MAG: ADP-ribosylation factor-like protein [Promethearchaeota archaeon]